MLRIVKTVFVHRKGRDALARGAGVARKNRDPNCLKGEVDLDSERGHAAHRDGGQRGGFNVSRHICLAEDL